MDLTNQRFGTWTVESRAQDRIISGNRHIRYWNCICDCGTKREVKEASLLTGKSQSCGCVRKEHLRIGASTKNRTHGMTDTRIYRIYKHIINRCYNPNDISYKNYGARGITVCNEWMTFEEFYNWASKNGYNDNLSIDRIDTNGNYEPGNCRWATVEEQSRNKRSVKQYEYNGESHCIAEWAELFNMNYKKLWKRIHNGWSIEKALTT